MYLYHKKSNDKSELDNLIVFNTLEEATESLKEWNEPKDKLYECIDITDLALVQEDRSKFDAQTFILYGSFGLKDPEK